MRRLIVNADDFGLTAGVNRGIREAHERGIVTSTTVLVTAGAAGEAEELRRACPELDIGLHVNLTRGRPACDPSRVPTLVDTMGCFYSAMNLLRRLAAGRIASSDVYREVTAQLQLLRSFGVEPSHWDAHQAMAFWAGLCHPAARAAADGGLRCVRTPRVWVVARGRRPAVARMQWRARRARRVVTEANRFLARRTLSRRFSLPDWRLSPNLVLGDEDYATRWQQALTSVPLGVSEIVSHPAHVDDELRAATPALASERAIDLRVLTDRRSFQRLSKLGIKLSGFRSLRL